MNPPTHQQASSAAADYKSSNAEGYRTVNSLVPIDQGRGRQAPLSIWRTLPTLPPSWKDIVAYVAEEHGITKDDILGRSRLKQFARPRRQVYAEIRARCGLSYPRIGQLIGGRHHRTIIIGERRHLAAQLCSVPKNLCTASNNRLSSPLH